MRRSAVDYELLARVTAMLATRPGATARELQRLMARNGVAPQRTAINRVLYGNGSRFASNDESPPRWSVRPDSPAPPPRPFVTPAHNLAEPPQAGRRRLFAWQHDALQAWKAQGFRGIVQAVTGTGKTQLGIEAVRRG